MGNALSPPRAFLFDVFGTLVDWRGSVARGLEEALAGQGIAADWGALADAWRGLYEPSMAPVRAGDRVWADLDTLHRESLVTVLSKAGIGPLGDAELDPLVTLWHRLDPWPDAPDGLRRLGGVAPCATCSNGHIALMVALARHADLRWDAILGAEIARSYKPAPDVYLRSAAALGCAPRDVMMVAAHNADLAAAHALGFQTAFVARPTEWGPHQTLDLAPDGPWTATADSLTGLAGALGC